MRAFKRIPFVALPFAESITNSADNVIQLIFEAHPRLTVGAHALLRLPLCTRERRARGNIEKPGRHVFPR